MNIAGICRFSLLGRGDWKAYKGVPDAEIQTIADRQSEILFAPDRMERRLATFEHLTLASIKEQTDKNFIFVVVASEQLPEIYKKRLIQICSAVPQVVLRFFPLIHVGEAQGKVFSDLGIDFTNTLQFRLDDDDAVCASFIQGMRKISSMLIPNYSPFSLSYRSVMFCSKGGEFEGIYSWKSPFFSAGAALYHPNRSIFAFGHYALSERFTSIIISGGMSLVTHNGINDTIFDESRIRRQKLFKMSDKDVEEACAKQFPFLTIKAKEVAGITKTPKLKFG